MHFLIVGTETDEQRRKRRESSGTSSAESFRIALLDLFPEAHCRIHSCVDEDGDVDLDEVDAIFFAGSPISMREDNRETRRARRFMDRVFDRGIPSFGSCAGLQIAVVAAGGTIKPCGDDLEAGFARGIVATEDGRAHPLLAGRAPAFAALTMHTDEVERLPDGATLLAVNDGGRVQAVEIRHKRGTFWGVQYHPEVSLVEIAASVMRDGEQLMAAGFAADGEALERHAERIDALGREPHRRDLRWQLGIGEDVTNSDIRRLEIVNFVRRFAGKNGDDPRADREPTLAVLS